MKLVPISERPDSTRILYELLNQRSKEAWISHDGRTIWEDHCKFVANHPYKEWYLLLVGDEVVGSIHLTQPPQKSVAGNEIGIDIYQDYWRRGYAEAAIATLIEMHGPGFYHGSVAPENIPSHRLFEKLGFRQVQVTYRLEVA